MRVAAKLHISVKKLVHNNKLKGNRCWKEIVVYSKPYFGFLSHNFAHVQIF